MALLGQTNSLRIVKKVDFGFYLDGESFGEILLPRRYAPENCEIDSFLEVFLYKDSEDRIIATTETPLVKVDECAFLKVVSVGTVGAFLDWGLLKDLLVPFREQTAKMEVGNYYLVYAYIDKETDRIVASAKLDKFLDNLPPEYKSDEEVDVMIYQRTPLGYKVVINNRHLGIIYENEVFQPLQTGQKIKAYIKKVREDDKIDLSLNKPGKGRSLDASSILLEKLKENNGFLPYSDKSPAESIYQYFGLSKKTFKMALGNLYKQRLITLSKDSIKLTINP
jgi:uncharacterized protein